jgi:hypothetical protein
MGLNLPTSRDLRQAPDGSGDPARMKKQSFSGMIRNKNFQVFATGIHGSFNQFFLKGGNS